MYVMFCFLFPLFFSILLAKSTLAVREILLLEVGRLLGVVWYGNGRWRNSNYAPYLVAKSWRHSKYTQSREHSHYYLILHLLCKKRKNVQYLHKPMEIIVDWRRISIVDFHNGWELFRGHQYFIFMEDCASEIDSPLEIRTKTTSQLKR